LIFIFLILIIFIIFFVALELNIAYIVKLFKKNNIIVWGKKRKGKDLLFQLVINRRKKEVYASNYPVQFSYGHKATHIEINDLSVMPNVYDNVILNQVKKIEHKPHMEKVDVYIADAGIYLPSHFHSHIQKSYPSLPIYYSIVGHLYDSNIHVNYNGSINRLYDKLREQADDYIKVLDNIKIFGIIFIKVRYYELYETAVQGLMPMKSSFFNKEQRALYQQYVATHGLIKDMYVYIFKKHIHYDTRYFRRLFFNL
jgi:hypothetical protein